MANDIGGIVATGVNAMVTLGVVKAVSDSAKSLNTKKRKSKRRK